MQLTGPGHWYHPANPDQAKHLLRRAVDHGVNHIDTADAYGPETAEHLIRKALHPYPDDLVIATKGGLTRQGPNQWAPVGRPEYLRQCVEMSLRRLGLERIDLYYLHRIDPSVPLDAQLGVLADMQTEGKIRHLGLSKVDIDQIRQATELIAIAAVQNKYHLGDQAHDSVIRHCEETQTAFVPYAPLGAGQLAKQQTTLDDLARRYRATRTQLALAWLLQRSSVILPIPGTSSEAHLDDNLAATDISLEMDDADLLTAGFAQPTSQSQRPTASLS
ncbi:aldo/keto reductase [Amycolatopsis sp. K13G38]|uniref:Aldo/keto reductase n=2 Tax=Amycolatopsis acididurans TaxID=2724524 RepID=A0ABX1JB26_9PSEU|nr:aldo/keto reductase [Amycolatopsis acididurans]